MYVPRPAPIATPAAPAYAYLRSVGPRLRVEVRWRTHRPAEDARLHISFVREFETGQIVQYMDGPVGVRGYSLPPSMLDRLIAWIEREIGRDRAMWLDEPRRPAEATHR